MFLFVCLGSSSHTKFFHSYGNVTLTGEGLQIFTYVQHSCPLNSEGSLVCHTYCDTGHQFIMVISKDLTLPVFTRYIGLLRLGFEHPTFASSLPCENYRHVRTWHIYNTGKTYIEGSTPCSRSFIRSLE